MTIIRVWLDVRVPIAVADTEHGTQMCGEKLIERKLASMEYSDGRDHRHGQHYIHFIVPYNRFIEFVFDTRFIGFQYQMSM